MNMIYANNMYIYISHDYKSYWLTNKNMKNLKQKMKVRNSRVISSMALKGTSIYKKIYICHEYKEISKRPTAGGDINRR